MFRFRSFGTICAITCGALAGCASILGFEDPMPDRDTSDGAEDTAPDASVDAKPQQKTGPFRPAAVIEELKTANADEFQPTLSADGLELYFASNRAGSVGLYDIWEASRADVDQPWSDIKRVEPLATTLEEFQPRLSPDGKMMMFSRAENTGINIYVTTRSQRGAPWSPPTLVSELSELADNFAGNTDSGLVRTLVTTNRSGSAGYDVYEVTRSGPTMTWGGFMKLSSVNSAGNDYASQLSPDGKTLYLYSDREVAGTYDVYMSTRGSPGETFSMPVSIADAAGLNTGSDELHPWMSNDGGILMFSRGKLLTSQFDLYQATR
jgi:hypothetical protein